MVHHLPLPEILCYFRPLFGGERVGMVKGLLGKVMWLLRLRETHDCLSVVISLSLSRSCTDDLSQASSSRNGLEMELLSKLLNSS